MAKKTKTKKESSVTPIRPIPEQINELASRLHGTDDDVFDIGEEMFGVVLGDEVFHWLEESEDGGIFKCDECNTWRMVIEKSSIRDLCCECFDAIEGSDTEGSDPEDDDDDEEEDDPAW